LKARLHISIVALVVTIMLALCFLHLDGVVGQSLGNTADRAQLLGDQIKTYVLETANRHLPSSQAGSLDEQRAQWYDTIRKDAILPRILERSITHTSNVVEILVLDADNRVLASSTPGRVGQKQPEDKSVKDWERQSNWRRLIDLFRNSDDDYALKIPLGVASTDRPLITIQVLVSPALIRREIQPKLTELASVSAGALLMSILLAVLVSKLFSRSLERIGLSIERITRGDPATQSDTFDVPEVLDVQNKLFLLDERYSGVRNDMDKLRTNVDQMLANLEEAVLVFGPDGRLQIAANRVERLLGRSRRELVGRTVEEIFPAWTGIGRLLHEAVGSRKTVRSKSAVLDRPDLPATRLTLSVDWLDYGDSRSGMLVIIRDAETQQQVATQLDVARRLAAISRVMSGVAHEIKNPLNAIMVHLELASVKADSTALNEDLSVVKHELLRLDRVVKSFLDFNRPLELQFQECDLVQVAQDTAALVGPQAQLRAITTTVEAAVEHAIIGADCDLLRQAVLNVVTNALEAMKQPGPLVITVDQVADHFVLSVRDHGDGIPPEIQDKIYNLYFTTKPSGNGIGLAMAYRVVQLHGGTISFDTELGKGTCFLLRFPSQQFSGVAA